MADVGEALVPGWGGARFAQKRVFSRPEVGIGDIELGPQKFCALPRTVCAGVLIGPESLLCPDLLEVVGFDGYGYGVGLGIDELVEERPGGIINTFFVAVDAIYDFDPIVGQSRYGDPVGMGIERQYRL
ncbi:hypothetical protein NHF46_11660 [Arthrobacter alpinus]|nr:hypothetical protein [Arthrobacter alpinus]